MDELPEIIGTVEGVHCESIFLNESFLDCAGRFADLPGTVVLMSGGGGDASRYHILATQPWLRFEGRHHGMRISAGERTLSFEGDPFETLRLLLTRFRISDVPPALPVAAGLFGYLSYDLKDCLEQVPRTSVDDLGLPHLYLVAPSLILIHDTADESTRLCIPERILSGRSMREDVRSWFFKIITAPLPVRRDFSGDGAGFKGLFTRSEYREAVKTVKDYIRRGDVYQVNLSQRFEMNFSGSAFDFFRDLYEKNPAPFFAFINAGDHWIVSTSPERFLTRDKDFVETRPIKGTCPRGKTPEEDATLRRSLAESGKNDAELSMIVDLLRNDLGKVCRTGSVRVAEHKRLEAYRNVYHLVSRVEGRLERDRDSIDLITAAFPGGSVTGCPKIRAMEIIDELEPIRRHVYTGGIGYISFHDTMDVSIAIRTATIHNNKIIFSVGGGIVFDSDPEEEYYETLDKGRTMMEVFCGKGKNPVKRRWVWLNGRMVRMERASIPIADQGFLYGYGFFETIRMMNGTPRFLGEHIARFHATWRTLFGTEPPDLTWHDIIMQVMRRNKLRDGVAAVKIIAAYGKEEAHRFQPTLAVMAAPYTHRLTGKREAGLDLAVYPYPRHNPLADHKTLNYLYYLLAGKWARSCGADEALIMNADGTVSETNSGTLVFIKGKTMVKAVSSHVLPGVMEKAVSAFLVKEGYEVVKQTVRRKEIFSFDEVLATNSLMGAVPVLRVDGRKTKGPSDLWQKINNAVW